MRVFGFLICCVICISFAFYKPKPQPEESPWLKYSGLYWAAEQGDLDKVEQLLAKGSSPSGEGKPRYSGSPLEVALQNHHEDVALLLLDKGATISDDPALVGSSILWDIRWSSTRILLKLIDRGLNLKQNGRGDSFLFEVAGLPKRADMIHLLISKGANPNNTNHGSGTALHNAVKNGQLESVQALIEERVKLDLQDGNGYTPLHLAAINQNRTLMKLLLKAGANKHIKDKNGATPLDLIGDIETLLKRQEATRGI